MTQTPQQLTSLLIKQNILKNITVLFLNVVLILWAKPYIDAIEEGGIDAFFFLSIFPLGAMFAYFAFRYSDTDLHSADHRALADVATFIFLTIICFSVSISAIIGMINIPALRFPFYVLTGLLITGCLVYDFWNLYCNLKKNIQ